LKSWMLIIARFAPLILSVAIAVLVWHWGFGRIDV
jgi:hypothetical protein